MVKDRLGLRVLSLASEVVATLGVVVVLLVGHLIWAEVDQVRDRQAALDRQLSQDWGSPSVAADARDQPTDDAGIAEGTAIGRLAIPKLGLSWVVVQGVRDQDIAGAPGHYPGTALPGAIGNFAVAGHRTQGMFWDLDQVQPGDALIVQTATHWYVYQVYRVHVVSPTSVEVVAPAPNQPGVAPVSADITLTTCNPKWDNTERLVVHGTLVQTTPADQPPTRWTG
jgi:sortase A